jgi:hypothetical protein
MIGDGFSVWSFSLSLLASSSITKSVPEPILNYQKQMGAGQSATELEQTVSRSAGNHAGAV